MINEKLRKEGDVAKKTQLAKIALLEEKIKSYGNRVAEQIQHIGNQGNIVEFKGERYFLGLPKSDTRIKSLEFQVEQVLKEVDSKEDFIRTEFRRSMGDLYAENTIVGEQLLDSIVELHFRLNALVRNMDLITVNRPEVDTDDRQSKNKSFLYISNYKNNGFGEKSITFNGTQYPISEDGLNAISADIDDLVELSATRKQEIRDLVSSGAQLSSDSQMSSYYHASTSGSMISGNRYSSIQQYRIGELLVNEFEYKFAESIK